MIEMSTNQKIGLLKKHQNELSYALQLILKKSDEKLQNNKVFQDNWVDYEESYGSDYNDCHGDYYDAE